jgi:hypothetical protein
MSGVAGLRGTGDWGTDERPKNFREMILFRNPNGSAPIFALTARARKKTVDDPEFAWWDEPNDIIRLQSSAAHAAGDTTLTVDSADPSSSAPGNVYGTATHLKPGDLLLVEPTTDSATFDHEVVRVVQVVSDTSVIIERGVSGTTAGTIANDQFLTLIGSSYAEGTGVPTAVSRNPIKYSNYTQIFKNTYELTGTADETRARTGDAWSNDKKRKLFDHSRDIEMAILWGRKSETTGGNGKPLRTMGGIRPQVASQNVTVFTGNVSMTGATNNFLDAVYRVFDFDTPAGDERICFAGNAALNALNKAIASETHTNVNYAGVIKTYGMNFMEYVLPQGRLLIKSHPLMNRHTLWTKSMFILDFASISYVPLRNRDTKVKDDVQNKDEDVRRGFIQTECSMAVDRGGLTCGYLGNIVYA